MDQENAGEDRHHGVARLVSVSDPGMDQQVRDEEKRQREHKHQCCADPEPGQQQYRCRAIAPAPSSSANAGNIRDVTAVPIPNTRAKSFAATPYEPVAEAPSTMPTTITSAEKTIFCVTWTRKFDELNVSNVRIR